MASRLQQKNVFSKIESEINLLKLSKTQEKKPGNELKDGILSREHTLSAQLPEKAEEGGLQVQGLPKSTQ